MPRFRGRCSRRCASRALGRISCTRRWRRFDAYVAVRRAGICRSEQGGCIPAPAAPRADGGWRVSRATRRVAAVSAAAAACRRTAARRNIDVVSGKDEESRVLHPALPAGTQTETRMSAGGRRCAGQSRRPLQGSRATRVRLIPRKTQLLQVESTQAPCERRRQGVGRRERR